MGSETEVGTGFVLPRPGETSQERVLARQQRTFKAPLEFRGVGLHTGKETHVVLHPAEEGSGVRFVRTDLEGNPEVRASGAYLKTRERRTCLNHGQAEVFTVEHLLAALWAMQIDNVEVHIDGDEVPAWTAPRGSSSSCSVSPKRSSSARRDRSIACASRSTCARET